jgi:hypothetical protein
MKRSSDGTSIANDKVHAFLYGRLYERIKTQCDGFAESIGASGQEIASRMGALLSGSQEIWELLGPSDSVQLRSNPTKRIKRKRSKVEMGDKSRKKPRISPWAKFDTPAKRSKEMARRLALRKKAA